MRKSPVDRRTVLLASGATAASLAGCISTSPTPPGSGGSEGNGQGGGSGGSAEQLKSGGSSTVYPIVSTAGSYWNSNYPPDDEEYWGPEQYGIQTDKNLAEYWASKYGLTTDGGGQPFGISVGLSHSGTGLEKLEKGQLDIGNASAPVDAELPDASKEKLKKFTNHVVGVDAQPLVVSESIAKAGVKMLTADQVRKIYRGKIDNWSQIPSYNGEDKEIQAIGRAKGSGTDTAFRTNMLGSPDASMGGVDVRKGQNQQVKTLVEQSNNAIAYLALAFVDNSTHAIKLKFQGKVYEPGKNLSEKNYPLSRDLHCYTWEGTSKKEAAFLRMIISDYGQKKFVKPEGYAKLTKKRQKEQMKKLPDAEQ
ncbi:PstS family phosphate ABC transporter substrate-binding protein [Halomicrococcus sp. SG-WS-1]|uniref:PstS family phosphate ABC transporter substrate-binding protein n=1 Tax=Halomicrococcus sp. SG-WS-1 TaxID=3439057 RepID=UPI003F78C62B